MAGRAMAGIRRDGLRLRDQRPMPGPAVFNGGGCRAPASRSCWPAHQARWCSLTPTARAQLAASPYLLVDAGFDDERRWAVAGPAHGARPAARPRGAVLHWRARGRFRAPGAGVRLAPGARQPAAGPGGAGHDTGLRRAGGRAAASRPRLAGRTPARLGATALGEKSGYLARPAARRRWR